MNETLRELLIPFPLVMKLWPFTLILYLNAGTLRYGGNLEKVPKESQSVTIIKKPSGYNFWNCDGILLIDYKLRTAAVTGAYYATLWYKF